MRSVRPGPVSRCLLKEVLHSQRSFVSRKRYPAGDGRPRELLTKLLGPSCQVRESLYLSVSCLLTFGRRSRFAISRMFGPTREKRRKDKPRKSLVVLILITTHVLATNSLVFTVDPEALYYACSGIQQVFSGVRG